MTKFYFCPKLIKPGQNLRHFCVTNFILIFIYFWDGLTFLSEIWDENCIFVTNFGRNFYLRHNLVYFNPKI